MKKINRFNFIPRKYDKKIKVGSIIFVSTLCLLILFFSKGFSENSSEDILVEEDTELIYYLTVTYDGVDRNGVQSDSSIVSSINSGTLYVEDKIPEGLIFRGFVPTEDGTIGAVTRSDGSPCAGNVLDDTNEESVDTGSWDDMYTEYTYHGLHFDSKTYTVNFKVENLQAGCELTVGIKTKTPMLDEVSTEEVEVRRDFYNFATVKEKNLTFNSNTVHAFMGTIFVAGYEVKYEYTGDIPDDAPELPATVSYVPNSTVGLAPSVKLDGYTFSGWSTENATVIEGLNIFTMPDEQVVFKGSFTENDTYSVKYNLDGIVPEGYVLPNEKSYSSGESINVDSLKEGDVFNGYRFSGWLASDVEINKNGEFVMPEKNVTLVGQFDEVTYNVKYQFKGNVIPSNAGTYLPATRAYAPGENVEIENISDSPAGYKFLGWYKSDFIMPEEDVIVYGEWKELPGTFEPTITNEIVSSGNSYKAEDTVRFKVTVTNTAPFPIKNVIIKSDDNAIFEPDDSYTKLSDRVVNVDVIDANESIYLFSTREVTEEDSGTIENVVEIKGALADNNYQLVDKDYVASDSFDIISQLKICNDVNGGYSESVFQFHITQGSGGSVKFDTWVVLKDGQCETLYLDPANYNIKEIVPQEYTLQSVTGALTANDRLLTLESGENYEVTFKNRFVKKGFFHSFGRIVNKIYGGATGE